MFSNSGVILLELLIVTLTVGRAAGGRTSEHLYNVSQIINNLLDDYDMRLRPNFGGEPCYIGMDIKIASFDSISEVNMDYTITMYLNQYWKDERLAFSSDDEILTLPGDFAELIWVPDTFFANDKSSYLHDVTEKNKMVKLHGDGSITYGMRFTTTLACMMDLHHYPLDVQNCTVEIESYGYTMKELVMYWKENPIVGVADAELAQFTIMGFDYTYRKAGLISPAPPINIRLEELATGDYRRLTLAFLLQRNIGYFIFQTYLPSILIVMLSWVSFWINHEATSARVALGITTVLTMTTISTGVRSSLPRISYVKAIDIYLVMCFVFVFAALLEYAAVNFTFWGQKAKKKPAKEKPAPPPKPPSPPAGKKPTEGGKPADGATAGHQDEIIELQDIRMSPIQSLRQRHNSKFFSSEKSLNDMKFPPSFRINRSISRNISMSSRQSSSRRKMMASLKRSTSVIKSNIPSIKDVNIIDKYSRVVFPFSFMMFNIGYWGYYYTVDSKPSPD